MDDHRLVEVEERIGPRLRKQMRWWCSCGQHGNWAFTNWADIVESRHTKHARGYND